MDIFTHAAAGAVAGSAMSVKFRNPTLILIGILGGVIPDIDAVSLWSGYNSLIAPFFGISRSGKEIYFAKLWYSHRGFMHSIAAGFFLSAIHFGISKIFGKSKKDSLILSGTLFSAYCTHLFLDYHTPAYLWGGMNLFWPWSYYAGGTGRVWWWNNYDVFLILVSAFILLTAYPLYGKFLSGRWRRMVPVLVPVICFVLINIQIFSRSNLYDYTNYSKQYKMMEKKSRDEQRKILGKGLYRFMEEVDRRIPFNF